MRKWMMAAVPVPFLMMSWAACSNNNNELADTGTDSSVDVVMDKAKISSGHCAGGSRHHLSYAPTVD